MIYTLWFAMLAGSVVAQDYPSRPIRVLTGAAGGSSDFTSRLLAHGLTERLKQQVIVDNRAGSVVILAEIMKQAPPDGTRCLSGAPIYGSRRSCKKCRMIRCATSHRLP